MHGPELIERILQIKLQIDHSAPEETHELQVELDVVVGNLELIAKVTRRQIMAAANKRYPQFLKEHCFNHRSSDGVT